MKRIFIVLIFSLLAPSIFADDYDIILSRVLPDVVRINSIVSDASTESVLRLRDSINTPTVGLTNPYFSDINYTIKYGLTGFRTLFHLRRIQDLARTYISDKNSVGGVNKYKNSPRVLSAIVGALEYYRLNQSTLDPLGNFTYKFIDYPREYTAALVMLRNALTPQQLQLYFAMIPDHTHDAKVTNYVGQNLPYTGANLMQNALCVFRRGVILKNATDLNNSIKAFSTMFDKNADDDGVMVDFAFYAHHQLYNGLYGAGNESIVIDYCITYVKGTSFYNTSAINKMGDYVLNGQYWFQYRKAVDFQIMGRQYIRIGTEHSQLVAPWVLDTLAVYDKTRASQYNDFKNHMINGTPFTHVGHKHFYTANMNVHRGANSYMSVKFPSSRFFSNECGNGQGLEEYYLALGGTYIMADGNEFMRPDRDINLRPLKGEAIPILNYSLIPGTTSIYSPTGDVPTIGKLAEITADKSVFNKQKGTNTFGGGLNAGGGLNIGKGGIAAYIQDQLDITDNGGNAYPKVKYTDQLVKAKKAYFFIGDAMLCMGASISSTDNNIVTTVNQHLTSGKVTVRNSGTTSTFSATQQTFANTLNWIHHDQIGYMFPQKQNVVVKNNIQTGFFNTGDHVGPANSGDIQAADSMFSVWIDHGNVPSNKDYQYIVIPNISANDLATRYTSLANEFSEIINTDTIQAVRSIKNNTYAAVFYKTGTCDFGDGFSIYVDKAALVYVEKNINGYMVSVSDPYYLDNNTIKVRVNKLLNGSNAIAYTYTTIITANMPIGDSLGSTITNQYNNKIVTEIYEAPILDNKAISYYPNPFSEGMRLELNGSYHIYDIRGVEVEAGVCNGSCEVGARLSKGIYIIETLSPQGKSKTRVSKN